MADAPAAVAPATQQAIPVATNQQTPTNIPNSTQKVGEGQAPPQEAVVKQEIKRLKSLKIKVDGHEYDEQLPFEIDDTPTSKDYMTKQLQMAKMGQNRANQAAELQKKVDAIGSYLEQAKGNPKKLRALIKELGGDEKEIAASIIEEEIANSQKSPEQLAHEKVQEELRALKEQRENEQKEWQKREFDRLQQQEFERYEVSMMKTLESSDVPKTPYTVKKMADYMLIGLQNGVELTPDDVLPLVRDDMHDDLKQMFAIMPEEAIEQLIGTDVLKKIRQKNIKKAKEAGKPPVPVASSIKDVGAGKKDAGKPEPKKSYKSFFGV